MELEELAESDRLSGSVAHDPAGDLLADWYDDPQFALYDTDPAPAWVDAYEI